MVLVCRDELIWILLQYVSGAAMKIPEEDCFSLLELYSVLYSGVEGFSVMGKDPGTSVALAPACLWIHLLKRLGPRAPKPPPSVCLNSAYRISLLVNVFVFCSRYRLKSSFLRIGYRRHRSQLILCWPCYATPIAAIERCSTNTWRATY